MSVLWSNEDWLTLETGLTDPCHPSETGLNKYKNLAWDAMGRKDLLSIKIMDGWHFQENTDCSFECYAHEMRMLLQTRYVGHAIDVLQLMRRYPRKSVPLHTKSAHAWREECVSRKSRKRGSIPPPGLKPATIATRWMEQKLAHASAKSRRIPPPGLNPATIADDVGRLQEIQAKKAEDRRLQEVRERNTASGQGSGGMEAESGASVSGGGSDEIEDLRKEWREAFKEFQQWNMPRSPPQGNRIILQFEKDTAKRKDPPQGNTVIKGILELENNTLRQKRVLTSQHPLQECGKAVVE